MQYYTTPPAPVVSNTPKCDDREQSPVPGCPRNVRERLQQIMDEFCEIADSEEVLSDRDRMTELTNAMRSTSSLIARIPKGDRG